MQPIIPILLITSLSLLVGCTTLTERSEPHLAVQHSALIKHFEDEAVELKAKIAEHQTFVDSFESRRYLYGRHADDLKAHSQEVIELYQKAETANREMADMVRQAGY
ncbi:hypothetical protein [Methylomonas koyamae]|uniref:hypothetical protein n=1 Tax=Methylomonas koyamae TaxID=702114 RepID=UPI0006D1CEA1|nr:hypothetical protein [Methylomonas koyamae]BBL60852.1 hypothetical protein MKFW12EY_44650 [Methylomonas koyamae]